MISNMDILEAQMDYIRIQNNIVSRYNDMLSCGIINKDVSKLCDFVTHDCILDIDALDIHLKGKEEVITYINRQINRKDLEIGVVDIMYKTKFIQYPNPNKNKDNKTNDIVIERINNKLDDKAILILINDDKDNVLKLFCDVYINDKKNINRIHVFSNNYVQFMCI